jgi:aminoglycoside phosphotransferase family enzyme
MFFLYDDPVIFDCIEFNSDYRRIDVLNDIAFLCVDLDFFGKNDLSERFYKKYLVFMVLKMIWKAANYSPIIKVTGQVRAKVITS